MPYISSVGTCDAEYPLLQDRVVEFAKEMFSDHLTNIDRLLRVFENGQIHTRTFVKDIDWYKENHSLQQKNDLYIEKAVKYGIKAMERCLSNNAFLNDIVPYHDIDAIFFISSTGLSTPSIEARIMNMIPFSPTTKRIPIWGLGCAGGASGLARAHEYCLAFPFAKVLVLCVELCSLTFQKDDCSKSNLVGTSLFADGVSAALVVGDEVEREEFHKRTNMPKIVATQSTLMPNSEEVMGWNVKNNGLHVVFSKDIPHIVSSWLLPTMEQFLHKHKLEIGQIEHFIAHPGGVKVLEAYTSALSIPRSKLTDSFCVLQRNGNMSSATVLYVLERFMKREIEAKEHGILMALGPGFSSETLLLQWE